MISNSGIWKSSSSNLDAGVIAWNGVALGTTNPLPNAASDAAGGLVISDAGGLDIDAMKIVSEGVNALRDNFHRGEDELDTVSFMKMIREKADKLNISTDMLKRPVNVGFSGGEKKRNEILQMALLEQYFQLDPQNQGNH